MKSKDLNFGCIGEFADYIVERVENDEELFLTVVGKFEEIKEIIKGMIYVTEVEFEDIRLESHNIDGYEDEYVLDCWCADGIVNIGCEPAKRDGAYLNFGGDETYLLENASSKIISLCDGSDLYFVNIGEDCGCDEDCDCDCPCECHKYECCIECSEAEEGDIHGFTASKSTGNGYHSYSFYTSNTLSKDDIRSILKELGF